ncbi:sulfatase [Rubellicoccus peritrichatus]|uniref:Sulfatase n=1 Tax=Rubellicoccus peritrichatus TaxID=3080537 RepID=A0AAQ3LCI2_9BACT|nr:sulfatase [Puniceicoccus sp. CR14]WOO41038.1 sulfatase [Puniceicoccus sp. CR14]
MIIVDDLRPETGAYGSVIKTPNMDRLAEEGTLFERAYCNSPVCGASRASLMTGIRPGRHRFLEYNTKVEEDTPEAVVIPDIYKAAGYDTFAYGKIFHHKSDQKDVWEELKMPSGKSSWRDYLVPDNITLDSQKGGRGPAFEAYDGPEAYQDEKIALLAANKLKQLVDSPKPFFMAVGFVKPHLPFNAPKLFWDLYNPEDIRIPKTYFRQSDIPRAAYHNSGELRSYHGVPQETVLPEAYARQLIHGYYAATSFVDAQIGYVLDTLDASGLRNNTIVMLLGDHGYNLGEHTLWCKHANFDHTIRTPLIISVPGFPEGQRTSALVEYVDLFPTLMDLTDLKGPTEQLDGISLVPVLKDPHATTKPAIVSKYKNGISLRTDRHLYTTFQRKATGETYATMLYDLHDDPLETRNLANDPAHVDMVASLDKQLRDSWGDNFEAKPLQVDKK